MSFIQQWHDLQQEEEAKNDETAILSQAFQELPTQQAFASLSAQFQGLKSEIMVIKRRTESF